MSERQESGKTSLNPPGGIMNQQNQPFVPEHNVVTDSPLNPDYSTELEYIPAPSAWKSIPGFVRVAVWIWSLAVVIGTVVGAASAVAWVFALASIFSQ